MELFSDVFSFTDFLFNILQTKIFDIVFCKEEVEKTITILRNKLSTESLDLFFDTFEEKYDFHTKIQSKRRKTALIDDPQQYYRSLYCKIINTLINQLKIRYSSLEELKFLQLFNYTKAKEYQRNFPEEALISLKASYGNFFDIITLRSELCVLYTRENFINKTKNVFDLLQYLLSNDLIDTMSEVFKLYNLVLTIPPTTASVERSFSALKRIKTYQRNTTEEQRLSSLALMSIEKDLLTNLTKEDAFYEAVIDAFAKKD